MFIDNNQNYVILIVNNFPLAFEYYLINTTYINKILNIAKNKIMK